jgi:predicted DNA-binding transcriptional regulator YafY
MLLIDLSEGPGRRIEDLAERHGVSVRTLQRDLQELRRWRIDVDRDDGFLRLDDSARSRLREWMGVGAA